MAPIERQVVLLPKQLNRLAELFPDLNSGAIGIAQNGSVVSAFNGTSKFVLDAQGESLTDSTQETYPSDKEDDHV